MSIHFYWLSIGVHNFIVVKFGDSYFFEGVLEFFKGIQARQVLTAERCFEGIYWLLICWVCASHIVSLPSWVVSASSCPIGLNFAFSLSECTSGVEMAAFEIAFDDPMVEGSDVTEVIVAV